MTMQMIVTYQKTKWIRSACWEALGGSQFGMTATAVVIPPAIRARTVSWQIAPRRTGPRAYRVRRLRCRPSRPAYPPGRFGRCTPGAARRRSLGRPVQIRRRTSQMGVGVSILLIAAGAILTWAVTATVSGVSIHTVGVILLIVGILGLVLSMI